MRRSSSISVAASARPRVAIAHDYLTQQGGAERVVLAMAKAFPDAPIYTTLYEPESTFPEFRSLDVRTSPLNRMGPVRRNHRLGLPLLPFASSIVNIDADLVIASSSGWSHGFRTTGKKLVYCYSPARWLYQSDVYLGDHATLSARIATWTLNRPLRSWDARAARSADEYLAISSAVRDRIHDAYGLESTVLPAPHTAGTSMAVEPLADFDAWQGNRDYYLCIARLLPYKNVDKVVSAFAGTSRNLVVVGTGPDEYRLRALASDNILMVKNLTDAQVRGLYRGCEANISASYEDYGLTPLEAALYGKPSVVLRWGGFLDTMIEGVTCEYFDEPVPSQIAAAVARCEAKRWNPETIMQHARQFDESHFATKLRSLVDEHLNSHLASLPLQNGR